MMREHNIVNSLYLSPEKLEETNIERFERYRKIEENEVRVESYMMDDASYALVAFGIASRVAKAAVNELRTLGVKCGLIRPLTVWPFPSKVIKEASYSVEAFISVELSMGQMIEDIRLSEECRKPVYLCQRAGGIIPSTSQIVEKVLSIQKGGK